MIVSPRACWLWRELLPSVRDIKANELVSRSHLTILLCYLPVLWGWTWKDAVNALTCVAIGLSS